MITVSVPVRSLPSSLLRRAISSILGQTYTDLVVVVTNDGGSHRKVVEALKPFDDPRLVKFARAESQGRYWSDAVVLQAATTEYTAVCDGDDWWEPEHLANLHTALAATDAGWATSHYHRHWLSGKYEVVPVRLGRVGRLRPFAHHCASLFRTEALRSVGGPHPMLRGCADILYTHLMALKFPPVVVETPTYHQVKRRMSLTTDPATDGGSRWRADQRAERALIWHELLARPMDEWGYYPRFDESVRAVFNGEVDAVRLLLADIPQGV